MGKIIQKVVKYAKSPEGQKVIRAGGRFIKQSGLAQKVVDKINQKVSKKTKKGSHLDQARENIYQAVSTHTKPSNGKGILKEGIEFLKESGLGEKGLSFINKKAAKKTSKSPALDIVRRLAASEIKKTIPFSTPGVDDLPPREATEIFNQARNYLVPPRRKDLPPPYSSVKPLSFPGEKASFR